MTCGVFERCMDQMGGHGRLNLVRHHASGSIRLTTSTSMLYLLMSLDKTVIKSGENYAWKIIYWILFHEALRWSAFAQTGVDSYPEIKIG